MRCDGNFAAWGQWCVLLHCVKEIMWVLTHIVRHCKAVLATLLL